MPLLMTTTLPNTEGMSEETLQSFYNSKVPEYARHLRELPADILAMACDACAKASPFFPAVADLFKHARPIIEKRQRQRDRVARLIAAKDAPTAAPVFVPEPEEVRLRAAIGRWRADAGSFLAAMLRRSAVAAEIRLAEIENRAPEEWALEQATESIAEPPRPPAPPPNIDEPAPWQAGAPVYQQQPEEPPLPDEIPE